MGEGRKMMRKLHQNKEEEEGVKRGESGGKERRKWKGCKEEGREREKERGEGVRERK